MKFMARTAFRTFSRLNSLWIQISHHHLERCRSAIWKFCNENVFLPTEFFSRCNRSGSSVKFWRTAKPRDRMATIRKLRMVTLCFDCQNFARPTKSSSEALSLKVLQHNCASVLYNATSGMQPLCSERSSRTALGKKASFSAKHCRTAVEIRRKKFGCRAELFEQTFKF